MNKELLASAFKRVGGPKSFLAWAASNKRAFFGAFAKELLQEMPDDVQHAAPVDPATLYAPAETALLQILNVRRIGSDRRLIADDVSSDVTDAGAADLNIRPGVSEHGITDTSLHGIAKTPAPQALLTHLESRESKPNAAGVPTKSSNAKPAQRVEFIPGLNAAAALGYGQAEQPDYGVNWSQQKAWY